MENILSKENIVEVINNSPDNFTQIFRSKKNYYLYGSTFNFINSNYSGEKFSEKVYKHIYGEKYCKKCGIKLTSKQFRSFFGGYKEEFCSKDCALHSKERTDNIKNTKIKLYGNASYNNMEKQKQTMLERHGVEHNWSGKGNLREKCYETNLKLHGSRGWNNSNKSTETKIKSGAYKKQVINMNKTCLSKYNKDFYTQTSEMKEKSANTNLKKLGVRYPSQHPDIIEKCYKKWKVFKFPSGKQINLQGYEPTALKLLIETFPERDIITTKKDMPSIWYTFNGNLRRYFPDIYLKSINKFIEVKSEYTFQLKKEENISKHNKCLDNGYFHEIWIFDKNLNLVEVIKNYAR